MIQNPLNSHAARQCTKCKAVKPLDETHFPRAKDRPLGFGYLCRSCERERSRDKNKRIPRRDRWYLMTPEQKKTRKLSQQQYNRCETGRAISYANGYRKFDAKRGLQNDIGWRFIFAEIFLKPCFYCGDSTKTGCDRIDNSKGHTKDNVVPACADCNCARGDRFNHEEMRAIGAAIRLVKLARQSTESQMMTGLRKRHDDGKDVYTA